MSPSVLNGLWTVDALVNMTGDKSLFVDPNLNSSPRKYITFGDNNKGKVIGLGKIAISKDKSIDDVLLVQSLGFNLILVGKLCDLGMLVLFSITKCISSWPLTIPSSLRELERVIFILWISLRVPQSKLVFLRKQPKIGRGTEDLVMQV